MSTEYDEVEYEPEATIHDVMTDAEIREYDQTVEDRLDAEEGIEH
ncbi:hypothetical protein [Streptomyces anulatus]